MSLECFWKGFEIPPRESGGLQTSSRIHRFSLKFLFKVFGKILKTL